MRIATPSSTCAPATPGPTTATVSRRRDGTSSASSLPRRLADAPDRIFVLGNPPQYEPGPESSVAALAATEGCEHNAIARYCDTIERSYRAFSDWEGTRPHPDLKATPAIFHSFQATLRKFGL